MERPRTTVLVTVLLVVLSVASGMCMSFRAEVTDLMPASTVESFQRFQEVFGAGESAFLLATADRPAEDGLVEVASRFAAKMERHPLVRSVTYGMKDLAERMMSPEVLERAPLFAGPGNLPELERLLTPEGIAAQVQKAAMQLGLPGMGEGERWVLADPLELRRFLVGRLSSLRSGFRSRAGSMNFLSEDGRSILVRIEGTSTSSDLAAVKVLVPAMKQAAMEAAKEVFWRAPGGPEHVDLRFTGGYVYAHETEAIIRGDLTWNNVGSMVLVLGIVALAYRRMGLLIPSFAALMAGMVIGFGVFSLIRRELVTLAFVSGAALAGLGIDYVIYVTMRGFSDPRGPSKESVLAAVGATGRPIFLAALATAAGFLTFPLAGERFLSDVGILSGVGIVACAFAAVVLLPAMLVPWIRAGRRESSTVQPRDFGAGLLTEIGIAWPRTVFWLSLALGAASVIYLVLDPPQPERDLRRMHPADSEAVTTQAAIAEVFGGTESPVLLFVKGTPPPLSGNASPWSGLDPELAAVVEAGRLEGSLRKLRERGLIVDWSSPTALVPPLEEQIAARQVLDRADPDALEGSFRKALEEEGFDPDAFAGAIATLRKALRPSGPITPEGLRRMGLADQVDRLVGRKDGDGYALIAVQPGKQLWRSEDREIITAALEEALRETGVRGDVAGMQILSAKSAQVIMGEFFRVSAAASAAIVLIVVICFRDLLGSTLALLPVALGTVWMFAACGLLGVPLNFMNVGVLPMVLGTGVDIGIHIAGQYLDDPGGDVRVLAREVGGSIMLAVLTTLASFGTMYYSVSPGLSSVGAMAGIGTTTCLLATLVTVPAALVLHERWTRRRGGSA